MKKDVAKIINQLGPLRAGLKRHRITLFIVCFLSIYTFLVYQINSLINREPEAAAISSKQQITKRLTIDQDSIDQILQLEEQNIDVKALFEQARNNPFNE